MSNAQIMLAGAVKLGKSGWDPPDWGKDIDEASKLDDLLTDEGAKSVAKEWVFTASRHATTSVTKPGQFLMDSAAGVSVASECS